jgi:predicted metal-dependent HD superfamily phosphohydrolase
MQWFQTMCDHYTVGSRFYHSLSHPAHLFDVYIRHIHEGHLRYSNAVNLAIWWHDAVYDATAQYGENEQRSANLMVEATRNFEPAEDIELAENLIMCTIEHLPDTDSPYFLEQATMIDLDLYGLSYTWDWYWENSRNVRRDFGHLADQSWLAGRLEWLHKFQRRKIFHGFAQPYEDKAKANIKRELQFVSQHGYCYDQVGIKESLA